MNPALPLLVLLSVAGLLFRRREIALPWVACGLAAMALLAPALSLSDGIPSPASALGEYAPWQGTLDARAGNPNLRDITHQVEPWLLFLRHELRAGRLPFWDPHQFSGSPYWSNGSGAPLFPLHLLFALLPLQLGLVLLPWLRLVIGGCGAWLLARELGLSRPAALVAALAFPLSGMITGFLLYPMANCHALVPWVLLAVERLAVGRGRWTALAWAGGLQLLGGHPETPVFTALLAGIYLLVRGAARPLRAWAGFVGGWIVALGLSAIQILPLFLTLRGTGKWLQHESAPPPSLPTVGKLLLRLVLPEAFGNPAAGSWWGPYNFIGTALYVGVIPLLLALGAVLALATRRRRTQGPEGAAGKPSEGGEGAPPGGARPEMQAGGRFDRRWLALAVMTGCALAGAYHLPGARQLLLALPVIQRGIHHYMKFGVELGLALFAARGWELWLALPEGGERRRPPGAAPLLAGAIVVCALLGLAWWSLGGDWRLHGLVAEQGFWTASALGAVALVGAVAFGPAWLRRALAPLALLLLGVDLCAAHSPTNPALSFSALYPRTGAVRFLEGRPERFAGSGTTLHPDAAMVYGLYDVRGDSPVKLERYDRVYGTFAEPDPVYFRPIRDWSSPWLDRLGVRWAVFGPREEAPAGSGWRLAYAGADAKVYERPTALPLVRLEGAPAGTELRIDHREPGLWRVSWSATGVPSGPGAAPGSTRASDYGGVGARRVAEPSPRREGRPASAAAPEGEAAPSREAARLVVAETWDPGWRARKIGGTGRPDRVLPVEKEDEILMAVPLPGPRGTVELRYRPEGFAAGAVLSAAALLLLALAALRFRSQLPANPVESPTANP